MPFVLVSTSFHVHFNSSICTLTFELHSAPVNLNRRGRVINVVSDGSSRPRFRRSDANRKTKLTQKKTFESRMEDRSDDVTVEELLLKKELLQQQLQAEVKKEKINEETKLIMRMSFIFELIISNIIFYTAISYGPWRNAE